MQSSLLRDRKHRKIRRHLKGLDSLSLPKSLKMSNTNTTSTPINTNPTIPNTNTNTTRVISPGSSSSSAPQACAACKYQRRRCAPDCPMAPHFPPTQPKNFRNVQRLFGVCKFLKLLRMVQPSQQHAAAKSMVVQANVRANEPVGGCYQIIREVERQIEQCKAELELVLGQLAIYRARAERPRKMGNPSLAGGDSGFVDVDALCVYNPMHVQAVDYDGRFQGQDPFDPLYMDLGCYDNVGVKVDMEASSSLTMVVNDPKQVYVDEPEDMKPLVGIYNEKQHVGIYNEKLHAITFNSKELIESRDKILMEEDIVDTVQQKQGDDLKGAASLFSISHQFQDSFSSIKDIKIHE